MTYDGGYVRGSMPFPGRSGVTAALGTWSGDAWRGSPFEIAQYRASQAVGIWRVVGVDVPARSSRSPILLLEPVGGEFQFLSPGDVLTFGEPFGEFTFFNVTSTTLPIKEDASILFGSSKLHGVACVDGGEVTRVLLFHGATEILPLSQTHIVWWNGAQYSVTVQQEPTRQLGLWLEGDVVVSRVIGTLAPVYRFAMDSGHEMLFSAPRPKKARIKDEVKKMFEPTVQANPGSVRLTISESAATTNLDLFVQPHEPLSLLAAALIDTRRTDEYALLTALGERVVSVKKYLGILSDLTRSAGDGVLRVSVSERPVISVARDSSAWLGELMRLPDRTCVRTGVLYAANSHRNWCKILFDDGAQKEDWTFRHKSSQTPRVTELYGKRVQARFSTRVPEGARSGSGILLALDPAL